MGKSTRASLAKWPPNLPKRSWRRNEQGLCLVKKKHETFKASTEEQVNIAENYLTRQSYDTLCFCLRLLLRLQEASDETQVVSCDLGSLITNPIRAGILKLYGLMQNRLTTTNFVQKL